MYEQICPKKGIKKAVANYSLSQLEHEMSEFCKESTGGNCLMTNLIP